MENWLSNIDNLALSLPDISFIRLSHHIRIERAGLWGAHWAIPGRDMMMVSQWFNYHSLWRNSLTLTAGRRAISGDFWPLSSRHWLMNAKTFVTPFFLNHLLLLLLLLPLLQHLLLPSIAFTLADIFKILNWTFLNSFLNPYAAGG